MVSVRTMRPTEWSADDVAREGGRATHQRSTDQHVGDVRQPGALKDHLETRPDDGDRDDGHRDRDEHRIDVGDGGVDLVEALCAREAGPPGEGGNPAQRDANVLRSWIGHDRYSK